MHNLHLVVTNADSSKDACSDVESYIEDFGTENNWRTIEGCISEDNEVYIADENNRNSWITEEDFNTIDKLNKKVLEDKKNLFYQPEVPEILKRIANGKTVESTDAWKAKEYLKAYYDALPVDDKFDILQDSYREYQYDEFGVTHTGYKKMDEQKTYVVFVNMHS